MKNSIDSKLRENGINPTGIYSNLPEIILDGVNTSKEFGFNYWLQNSTAGPKIQNIVKELI